MIIAFMDIKLCDRGKSAFGYEKKVIDAIDFMRSALIRRVLNKVDE